MQKNDRRIIKNFIYNICYQILAIAIPLITSPYLSRTLGKNGLGQYQYTYAVASYFATVCMLGLGTYGNRECAIRKDNQKELSKTFGALYMIQLVMSAISLICYASYVILIHSELQNLFWIQIFHILSYAVNITWLFYGMEEFGRVVLRDTLVKVITVLLILLLIHDEKDVPVYCLIMTVSLFASQIFLWPFSRKYVDWNYISFLETRRHWKPIILLYLPAIGVQVYATVDRLMLGKMIGMDAVGLYGAAEGIAKMPYGIVTALTVVMLPKLSCLSQYGEQKLAEKYRKNTMQVTMMIAFPVCMGLAAISEKLIPWYLAEEFSYCAELLKYLVVIILFLAWTDVIQKQCIIPLKKDMILVKSAFLTAAFNVAANLLLIPRMGLMGAVCGTVLSEALVMCYKTFSVRKEISVVSYIKTILPYGIFSGIMFLAVKATGRLWTQCSIRITLIEIFVGGIVYLGLCSGWILITQYLKKERKRR